MKYFIRDRATRLRSVAVAAGLFCQYLCHFGYFNVSKALAKMQCPDSEQFHKTSDFYKTCKLPKRFEYPSWFHGYGVHREKEHPFYRTTTSEYGRYPPTVHTVTTCFYPNTQEFTKVLVKTGMYRNYSLNTGLDQQNKL